MKMQMIMKSIDTVCRQIVRWLGIILVGYLFLQGLFTICCIQRVEETTFFMSNNVPRQLLGIIVVCAFLKVVGRPYIKTLLDKHGEKITWGLLGIQVIFLCIWVAMTQFWANSDMEKIYQYAGMLLAGDYSGWLPGGYPYGCPHQNGLLLMTAGLLSIFSTDQSYIVFYGLNILFYAITIVSLHLALRKLFPQRHVYCAQTICLICYLPYAFFVTFLYGNMIGFGFAAMALAWAIYFVYEPSFPRAIGAGICMMFGIIFKQNEMIIFVAILGIFLFTWITKQKYNLKCLGQIAIFLTIVLLGIKVPNWIVQSVTDIEVGKGYGNGAYIAMGLMEENATPGWYNGINHELFEANGFDTEMTDQASMEIVAERINTFVDDPAYAWSFFNRKIASEWNNPTFQCFGIQNARATSLELNSLINSTINDGGKLNIVLIYLMDMVQSITLFGVLIYLIQMKDVDWGKLLFVICFIGAFVFWMFWEAKCQYVVPFYLLLIPYSILGYREMMKLKLIRISVSRDEEKLRIGMRGMSKLYLVLTILLLLIGIIAMSHNQWILDAFKMNHMTQEYYDYIHQFGQNMMGVRF